ncbi:uncharacterized protein LOC131436632 [Malaya genurostris]|uniref:uncharacterized protein LOC131436632 n=1 Tax=Malaya genurostris TaxID=325434 RepID=UPI0026F3C5B1|nr:uncharacterized protein LOC131436632 [Malaya genurostris]
MNRWLTLVCVLGLLSGAHSFYASIAVGGNGLVTIANNFKTVSTIMANYFTALNAARTPIIASLNDLMGYVNKTYTALNITYGASQANLVSLLEVINSFNQSITYADQMVTQGFTQSWGTLINSLNQGVQNVLGMYSSLLSSSSYPANVDNCTVQNATRMANIPNIIANAAQCLQVETNQITAIVPVVLGTIATLKSDLVTLNNNLAQICNAASPNCINLYFSGIYQDYYAFFSELYLILTVIQSPQQFAIQRDQACGNLALADAQDEINDLMNSFTQCAYPSQ